MYRRYTESKKGAWIIVRSPRQRKNEREIRIRV
jgi:hypothetical protein